MCISTSVCRQPHLLQQQVSLSERLRPWFVYAMQIWLCKGCAVGSWQFHTPTLLLASLSQEPSTLVIATWPQSAPPTFYPLSLQLTLTLESTHRVQDLDRVLQHRVQLLQRGAALQLFRQAAGLSGPPGGALEEVEAAILEACGGLPLALKLVGGLLRGTTDRKEWQVRTQPRGGSSSAHLSVCKWLLNIGHCCAAASVF
jgi:hypothetical protein